MPDLRKIVRARLAAQPVGGHPDADVLTAFAEDALIAREREQVMVHLAACSDCREVVALIAPAEGPPLRAAAEKRQWFTLAVLRWAAIPATVAVIVGAVLLHNGLKHRAVPSTATSAELSQPQTASGQAKTAPPQSHHARTQLPEPESQADRAIAGNKLEPRESGDRDRTTRAAAPRPSAPTKGEFAARKAATPALNDEAASNQSAVMAEAKPASPPPPLPMNAPPAMNSPTAAPAADTAAVTAAAPTVPLTAPAQADRVETAEVMRKPAASRPKSKSAPRTMAAAPIGGIAGGTASTLYNAQVSLAVEFRISSTGKLERRLADASWQPVAIDNSATFRALARIGNDIWAGGNTGVLYHSDDGGATWQRVAVPTADDIVGIAFNDRRYGTIRTANGQQYITRNAGVTWERAKEG